jgi:hypothetical protein
MNSKSNLVPTIQVLMTSFSMMPTHDAGIVQLAQFHQGKVKRIAKFKKALSTVDVCRVIRSPTQIVIEYLRKIGAEGHRVQARMIYQLASMYC